MVDNMVVQVVQSGSRVDDAEKDHTIDRRRCQEKVCTEFTAKLAHKKRSAHGVESLDIDAPPNADELVGIHDVVSEGK